VPPSSLAVALLYLSALTISAALLPLHSSGCTRQTESSKETPEHRGPPVDVRTEVDKAEITPDETLTFRVVLEADPGIDVSLPEVGSRIEGLRIVEMIDEGPTVVEGRKKTQRVFKLKADLAGSYILPGVEVHYKDAGGEEHKAATGQIFVTVKRPESQAPQTGERGLKDIKPLQKIERPLPRGVLIASICSALGLAGLLAGILFYRKRKHKTERTLTPEERAQKELQDLLASGLLEEGRAREFVFGLSMVFRRYLERKYSIRAAEHTTEEIMADLRGCERIDEDRKRATRSFLAEVDPVKYRGVEPSEEEVRAWIGTLESFLQVPVAALEAEGLEEAA